LRIRHEIPVLILRVEATDAAADFSKAAVCGKVRPRRDVEPPPLIVGEVEMEAVDLVERDQIDVPLDLVHLHEMTGDIQHRAPPWESRPIDDARGRDHQRPRLVEPDGVVLDEGRHQLAQRLDPVEQSRRTRAFEHDAVSLDR
jgi:hypothetical protein